jgi:hypothetical protein
MGAWIFRGSELKSVEADEVGAAFGGIDEAGDLFGGAVGFSIGANADPVAGGAAKVDDVGAGILALQAFAKPPGPAFMMEGADLNAPATVLKSGGRVTENVDADARGAGAPQADFEGGGAGQIQNAAGDERSAVRDGDDDGTARGQVGDAHDGAHGQGTMSGGHGVLVVDFPVGSAGVVVGRAIPAGDADFSVERTAVGLRSAFGIGRRGGLRLDCWRRRRCGCLDMTMPAAGDKQAENQRRGESGCGAHPLPAVRMPGSVGMLALGGKMNETHFSFCCRAGNLFFQFYLKPEGSRLHPY